MNVNFIIGVHNNACANIVQLEETVNTAEITDEKDKANFGNLCIALHGFRMVANATEALLKNEDCLKGDDGFFYKKVEPKTPATYKKVEPKTPAIEECKDECRADN